MVGADGRENVPHREWLLMFDQVQSEIKMKMKIDGREDAFIGAKVSRFGKSECFFSKLWHAQIIYSTIRSITPEELEWYFEDCIALKKEFPHIIAGLYLLVAFFFDC